MGNPVYKEKEKDTKMSFLRHVIRRSNNTHPLRSWLQQSSGVDDDLESILLDNINPRIINMSVEQEESPEEIRLSDFNDLFLRGRSSFYRWQQVRGTRPTRSSVVPSRIPRALNNILRNNQMPENP
jgi:hypothetical protein